MNLSPTSRIAIIAALPGELKPLVQSGKTGNWQPRDSHLWTGRLGRHEAIAIAGGMGAAAAARAVDRALAESQPEALVSYGWAGAITCAVKPPSVYPISEVVDAITGERFATASSEGLRLLTLDHVARPDEKRALAQAHEAVLVDMEAATVARIAATRNLAFYCFKGISDGYTDNLPDFNRFISPEGQLRMPAFLLHAALHPGSWGSLQRLGKNSSAAATNLADILSKSLP